MIISHKHKFIFIKPKKCAGTSVEIALSTLCGSQDTLTPMGDKDEKYRKEYSKISAQNYHLSLKQIKTKDICNLIEGVPFRFRKHMTAAEIRTHISPNTWEDYFTFSIERNPFDKVVSLYYWRGGDKKYGNINSFVKSGGLANFKSFEYYTSNGLTIVDKVFKYEELDIMCSNLTKRFELTEPLEMPKYMAKSATRKVRDYRQVLDEETREIIEIAFAREIKLFNYQF